MAVYMADSCLMEAYVQQHHQLDPFNTANNTPKSVMETRTITSNDYRVQTSGDITITIIPGLDFKTLGSVYVNYNKRR